MLTHPLEKKTNRRNVSSRGKYFQHDYERNLRGKSAAGTVRYTLYDSIRTAYNHRTNLHEIVCTHRVYVRVRKYAAQFE